MLRKWSGYRSLVLAGMGDEDIPYLLPVIDIQVRWGLVTDMAERGARGRSQQRERRGFDDDTRPHAATEADEVHRDVPVTVAGMASRTGERLANRRRTGAVVRS